jgi:hypothetical protein
MWPPTTTARTKRRQIQDGDGIFCILLPASTIAILNLSQCGPTCANHFFTPINQMARTAKLTIGLDMRQVCGYGTSGPSSRAEMPGYRSFFQQRYLSMLASPD